MTSCFLAKAGPRFSRGVAGAACSHLQPPQRGNHFTHSTLILDGDPLIERVVVSESDDKLDN
jgi:hypothetical protein